MRHRNPDSVFIEMSHMGQEPPPKKYSIFDPPDGENCIKNCEVMLARGTVAGSYLAVCEMIALSKPTTPWAIAGRFCTISLPVVSMAVAYPALVCVTHQIRQKDGVMNHFIAGFLTGTIMGARLKSQKYGILYGAIFGTIGGLCKMGKLEGIDWLPHQHYKAVGMFDHYRRTFIPGLKTRQLEASDTAEHEALS